MNRNVYEYFDIGKPLIKPSYDIDKLLSLVWLPIRRTNIGFLNSSIDDYLVYLVLGMMQTNKK